MQQQLRWRVFTWRSGEGHTSCAAPEVTSLLLGIAASLYGQFNSVDVPESRRQDVV